MTEAEKRRLEAEILGLKTQIEKYKTGELFDMDMGDHPSLRGGKEKRIVEIERLLNAETKKKKESQDLYEQSPEGSFKKLQKELASLKKENESDRARHAQFYAPYQKAKEEWRKRNPGLSDKGEYMTDSLRDSYRQAQKYWEDVQKRGPILRELENKLSKLKSFHPEVADYIKRSEGTKDYKDRPESQDNGFSLIPGYRPKKPEASKEVIGGADHITEPYGPHSVADLQMQKGVFEAIRERANQEYVGNPYETFVSGKKRKKEVADLIEKETERSDPFFKKEAKTLYDKPSEFPEEAKKLSKALKVKSLLKNADKMTGSLKNRFQEINEKYGDYASDNLGKLLAPFQHGQMKHHGQTGNLASNFLSNVAKHREKEKSLLFEKLAEKSLDSAQRQSFAKAQHKQGLIQNRQQEDKEKQTQLAHAYDYKRRYNKDFEEDVTRTVRHHEEVGKELQEEENFKAKKWKEQYEHPDKKLQTAIEQYKGMPKSEHSEPLPKRPDYVPNPSETLAGGLAGLAGGLSKTHKREGGRLKRAVGGELLQEATENAQRNTMDPLQSLKNVSRYDQIKAIEQKMKERQQHKKGEKVVAQSSGNPITEGSRLAKEYALQDKASEHARHLEQPRELNPMTAALEGFAQGISEDPSYGHVGRAFIKGREGITSHEHAEEARKHKAATIQKEIAKEMRAERKDNRHMDLSERKAAAQEAHYKAQLSQHERHHQDSLSKQDLAEKRFNALHGKAGVERPFNEKEHKRLKEAKALRQKAAHLIKQARELRELTNPETGITTGNLFGNALESVGSHQGQNFLAGDRAKAERVRTISGDLIFSKHGELKNIPRSNEILARLDQVKPSLNMSPEAFLKAVDDVEILGHHLNDLASETAGDLEESSPAPSDHSSPDYSDDQREADEKELQKLYAKEEASRTANRKKLGDVVKRYKRAEGGLVPGSDVWKTMMSIPLTRDLLIGLREG